MVFMTVTKMQIVKTQLVPLLVAVKMDSQGMVVNAQVRYPFLVFYFLQ